MEKREFGSGLRSLRKQAGLSQRELAERVGIDFSYLSKIENGVMSPPSQQVILRLAEVLDADRDELLTLAGKVPFDIAQMLKNLDVLQSLRGDGTEKQPASVSKMDSFGKRLRELREASGLSQADLADQVGISFTYLSKIENGVKPPPSEKVILKLAEILRCDKDELMASAGKVPSDIARILKNREVRQSLRENQARRTKISASGIRKGINTMKQMMSGRSLVRVALAFVLVLATAASLWFSSPSPVKALKIDITNPAGNALESGTVGQTYHFQLKITVENGELLPINNIDVAIFNSTNASYMAHLMSLPLVNGVIANYSDLQTGGGAANVTTSTANLTYSFAAGGGYVSWNGSGVTFPAGYGYGGQARSATITYAILWTPPSGWPIGNYNIAADITNATRNFTQSGGFTLESGLMAETGISSGLSSNATAAGVVVVNVNINRIKNSADDSTATLPGGLGSYTAMVSTNDSSALQFLTAYSGMPPCTGLSFNGTTGIFGVSNVISPIQPSNHTVAELVPVLTGSATTSVRLSVAFQTICAAAQTGLSVPEVQSNNMTLRRGDADKNGVVSIVDSLAIKQYLVAQLTLSQINPLNAAGPNHDGAGGDKITVVDALAIEQFLVGQRNAYYQ